LVSLPVDVLRQDYLARLKLKVLLSGHILFTMKVQTKSTFMGI